ncbi:hypothetical protein B0H17DRAFT_1068681 [Mycena rosella]|uniref:AMP-activated protein kinase glycogen-binding domain-containing protein n=1 Tax=Mycena rosella TaxID=1033263 RepID=A0AAD7DD11_MYCRO|nr:hypothetical protein B0H17DRAFT_1068681 [Mycena rosella]
MDDLHEVHFTWPSTEPSVVVVTGTFDEWTSSVHLTKKETGFHGSTRIPWDTKIAFKYIVDSNWVCETTSPTETDTSGNVNNVYKSPPKPSVEAVESVTPAATAMTNGAVPEAIEKTEVPAATDSLSQAHSDNTTATGEPATEAGATYSELASDFANTVAARDGTSSAFEYVTSALGAAIQGQIGVDPLNGEKFAVETPKPDAHFTVPELQAVETSPVAAPDPSPIASAVPIQIVPVNAEGNNTSSTETPAEAAPVAPDVPVSQVSAALETPPAVPQAEPAETPSTHKPLPAVIPTPTSTPSLVTPEAMASPDAPSEPVVTETTPENKIVETSAPSEPLASPAPEPVATVSETTPVSAETVPTEPAVVSVPETTAPATEVPAEPNVVSVPETTTPATEAVPAEPNVAQPKQPSNGVAPTSPAITPSSSTLIVTPTPSAPATPAKNTQHSFPSSETESPSSNNSSPSKFGTVGSRKNRKSIFGKFKGIFSGDKEEKEKK